MNKRACAVVVSCFCVTLLSQDKTRIYIDASVVVRQLSSDYLTRTETDEEATDYANDFFLKLEECDRFLLAPSFGTSDYTFKLGGLLTWHPGEIQEPWDDQDFDFPYETIRSGRVWIQIWDITDMEKPAIVEEVEAGSLLLLEDVGILSLIEDVVKDACKEMKEDLPPPQYLAPTLGPDHHQ